MKIGIIGAGHIGGTLAKLLTKAGHEVEIANSRGPETLADVAEDTGAKPVTAAAATRGKDLIVLTIPLKAVPDVAPDFRDVPASVPVLDTCNYYPRQRDGKIDAIENGMTESQWVAQQIGHPTVKVFNNITFKRLGTDGKPKGSPDRVALPVSADDPAQRRAAMALVDELGFEPIDNGPLSQSFRQQPGTPSYLHNGSVAVVSEQLNAATPQRQPEFMAA